MGFRFRRSLRVAPGIRLNLSKSGLSTSLGGRGASLNLGPRGTRTTLGIPGTGLSWSQGSARRAHQQRTVDASPNQSGCTPWLVIGAAVLLVAVCSKSPNRPTSRLSTEDTAPTVFINTAIANCRSGPTTSSSVVTKLQRGASVQSKERSGLWTRVMQRGVECWVANSLISATAPNLSESSDQRNSSSHTRPTSLGLISDPTPSRKVRRHRALAVYYRNCSEARAAGAAPVYASDPGYAPRLDRDGDGVGCE
jgi:uncharacterized protein YraI